MAFGVLSERDQEAIHGTSLRLLSEVGVRVSCSETVSKLLEAGARGEREQQTIYLDESVLNQLLSLSPSKVVLGARSGPGHTLSGKRGHAYWPGNALYMVEGDARRSIGIGDFERLTRLVDRLEHPGAMVGVAVGEFDPGVRDFCTLRLMAQHTGKHLRPVITSPATIVPVMEMAKVLDEGNSGSPSISFGYSVVSPLHWTETALRLIAGTSGQGYPIMLNAEPMAGGTSPVTLAGSVAQANAETLAGIAIAQVHEPGRPCFYNGGFAHTLDMKTTVALGGSAEVFLMGAASAAMARFYHLPCASWVSTESMAEDAQAASEKGMGFLLHVERGINLIWGMGQLESQMSISAEQLVIDDEIIGQVGRLQRGIEVDSDHLAFDVMREVGISGDFLSHSHTFEWFKEELSEVRLGNRNRREVSGQQQTIRDRASDRIEELLGERWEPVLPDPVDKELRLIESWWCERARQ